MNREKQWVKISLMAFVCVALILVVYVFMELNRQSTDNEIFVTSANNREENNGDKEIDTKASEIETEETLKDNYDLVSGVYMRQDGSVVSVYIEEFDKNYYSLKELRESYVEPDVQQYNEIKSVDEDNPAIKILDLKMIEKNVALVLEYQTCQDYLDYNSYIGGTVLYDQTVNEAIANDQVIEGLFLDTQGNEVSSEEIRSHGEYYAVAIDFESIVQVQGEIVYASSNVDINNGHTATTNGELSYIIYR